MNELDRVYQYFLSKTQSIELDKKGMVVHSNNILFNTVKNEPIGEIHPFFEIVNDIFNIDDDEIHFKAIHLDLQNITIIADIAIYTGNNIKNPVILLFNNTDNYTLIQEVTQQKNDIFIANFFETQKLMKSEEEKALKNQFLANITDDLKTPISSVSGLLELFQKSNLTFDQIGLLKIIRSSMSHLNRLVNDVLDLTKSEMGVLNIEIKPFDFNELIQNIEKLFANKFLLNGIDFKLKKSERIPQFLIGDRERVMQIMDNLLENAYKYTEKGEVNFEIKIDNSGTNKLGLSFIITDTGVGFDDSIKEQLFKSFKKSHEKENDGPGIGLSLVGNLVKLLNGSIKFESKLNHGSKFSVFLPFTFDISHERKAKISDIAYKKIKIDKKVNVLLIDDNEIKQLVLMKLLVNHEGFFIDIANDSDKAMEMVLKEDYDILFIDLNMSRNNGFEAISSIRNSEKRKIKKLPIVALTGYESETERKKCKQLKVNDYIVKPYKNEELFTAIYKILKLS
jgi:two-component system, sensor histidine kinase